MMDIKNTRRKATQGKPCKTHQLKGIERLNMRLISVGIETIMWPMDIDSLFANFSIKYEKF